MMVRQDQPPLTRRQARANERAGITQPDSPIPRRATTSQPTPAGDIPSVTTQFTTVSPQKTQSTHPSTPTRRELRALRQAQQPHNPYPKTETGDPPSPVIDKVTGRIIEIDPKPAELFHPSPPEWTPLPPQQTETTDNASSFDELLSGGTGSSAATTTNALIMPSIPQHDATKPLDGTGEILITGSIDLPASLGSTGQHPNVFDGADIDHLLDNDERDTPRSGAVPIRASSAISTQTSTRGVIMAPPSKDSRLPTMLMIVAAALAIGVAAVLIAGFIFGAF